jgi:hypothetical protein
MKKTLKFGSLILTMIALTAGSSSAQRATTISGLKSEIIELQKIVASADTPASVRASKLRMLSEGRVQLRTALRMQIESLRKYQAAYGHAFSTKEIQSVTNSIRSLESQLQDLGDSPHVDYSASSPVQEKGHAEKTQRTLRSNNDITDPASRGTSARSVSGAQQLPQRRSEDQHTITGIQALFDSTYSTERAQALPAMNVKLAAMKTSNPTMTSLVGTPIAIADPKPDTSPEPNAVEVDWETRSAGCPTPVTQSSTRTRVHVTGINDLIIDFKSGNRVEYQLRAKGTPVSAVPENPFPLPPASRANGRRAATSCSMDEAALEAKLKAIRDAVDANPKISAPTGGKIAPWSETYAEALKIPEVRDVLRALSQAECSNLLDQYANDPVLSWVKRLAGSHSYDFNVVLEPNQNYEFTLTESWMDQKTAEGTIRWNCGEKDVFSLSVGPLISFLPSRTYNHQKAPVPVPGSSTTQDILSVGNGNNVNVLGAALINYHFPRIGSLPNWTGLTLSAGPVYTLGSTPEVSALGLFVGTSVHLTRSVFITPGIHIGEFADFPTGFAPGSVIPDQFGDLNPVKRRTAHFAIGLTYKTNSFKKSSENSGAAKNSGSGNGNGDSSNH